MSSLVKKLAAISKEARLVLIGLDCVEVSSRIAAFVPNEKMINFVP